MKNELFSLYVLAEAAYTEKYNYIVAEKLFPSDWYNITNYELKIKIISEALKNNILIYETELYKSRNEDTLKL